ncbi:hypothetical protein HUJ05_003293 [Dendroctonus ponderosae]|nr:hypothetical protein HUJ05_003293 [Dendroctonus ponderosae]
MCMTKTGVTGPPSIQTDEIISQVDQALRSARRLTISNLAGKFPQLERTTVYNIVTENLAVVNWFNSQAASFYADGLKKMVQRYEKCLEVNGDYIEK